MFDSVVGFYNNLFTIEIAVFGIIAAAIFVFLQIVYSQFSYREVSKIFLNFYLVIFFVLGVLTLCLTALGSLVLSFPELNVNILNIISAKEMFQNWITASSLIALFFLSLIIFAIFIYFNIRNIKPTKIALLVSKKINHERIYDFLLRRYGIPEPNGWFFQIHREVVNLQISGTTKNTNDSDQSTENELQELKEEKQKFEKELSENKREYEKIKQNVEHSQDPLEPLDALMLRSINTIDLITIKQILSVFESISNEFLLATKNIIDRTKWNPYSEIKKKYLIHLTNLLRFYWILCDRQQLNPIKMLILDSTSIIATQMLELSEDEIKVFLGFWKENADNSIGKSRVTFNRIIQLYRNLITSIFKKGNVDNNELLYEIFRHLGWLGERLISQKGIEEKPLMRDYDYTSEFDELFDSLLSTRYDYCEKYSDSYPLIYFNAIDVVFLQLILVLKKKENIKIEEYIFDCVYVYFTFAEAAIRKGNSRGAALATFRIKQSYEKLVNENLEKSAKENLKLLVRIMGLAYKHKDKLERVDFMKNGSIVEEVKELLLRCPYGSIIKEEIFDANIHEEFSWDLVIELGKVLHTNFGFTFDWETGKLYPPDDPRRR